MKTTQSNRRSGFTLIELLIVISIIAILAAVSIPTTAMVMNKVRKTQAGAQVANLVNAIKLYEAKYGSLPIGGSGGGEEQLDSNENFMDILTGEDSEQNPQETEFFEGKVAKPGKGNKPARGGMVDQGGGSYSLVDPWGNEYVIIMDADGDKQINVPRVSDPIRGDVVVWSYGKPGDKGNHASSRNNDTSDWVKSW